MKKFSLKFANDKDVNGEGIDCIGKYEITGMYSLVTNRMALDKIYIKQSEDSCKCNKENMDGEHVRTRMINVLIL